ncbi:phage tail protein [Clostridium perfringens]|uniref:phage tail protein n=1 Tax=Clostridium TaxID=1485 RepID=UPI0009BE56FE|nr:MULTISPECIES: phage tail protein [Clostridium]MDK7589850.1 phage tail protein [Clostridium sp. UMB9555B]MDK7627756.1 phage tail protein [Clostridium sp. UMB9555A]
MLYIFDRKENLLEILTEEDYSDFKHITKVNSSDSLSFSTSKKKNIKKNNKVGFFKDEKFQLFLIYDFNDTISLDENKIDIECISDFNSLGNFIIEDKRVVNGTLREAAQKALEGMDYQVGVTEEFELRNINFYFISRLKAFNDILDTFKAEFDIRIEIDEATGRITNKYIDFKHRLGEDTGLRFTFDTNLKSIEKSPVGDHFNVLYGRGKSLETDNGGFSRKLDFAEVNNGKKYVEDIESISKYGRLEGIFSDDNISDKRELLNKTLDKLQEVKNPKFTYKVTLEYLNTLDGFEHYKCQKGDTIIIIDEEENLVLEARILEIEETEDIIITLGSVQVGLVDSDFESEIGDLKDKVDILDNNKPTIDNIYPDTLPDVPILKAKALYSSVILDWSYSNKEYYTYELFASKIKDFNPTSDNRIFEGKASSFLHEVKPSETWYYRVRAKNTYGKTTLFSPQIKAVTFKISDSAEIFEEAAIGHAIIRDLDMDKATVGKLKGQRIDARNLTVTDGNGKRTLDIDSFGNVALDVTSLNIRSKSVSTKEDTTKEINESIKKYKKTVDDSFQELLNAHTDLEKTMNGVFKDGILTEAEKKDLEKQLNILEIEKNNALKEVEALMKREELKDTNQLLLLNNAKQNFIDKHYSLINAIREVIGLNQEEKPTIPNISIFKDIVIHFPHFSDKHRPAYPDISLIENHNGDVYLFDGGEKISQYDVEKYLYSKNIFKVDKIFITHSHSDHISGIPYLIDKFGCKELYCKTPDWNSMPSIEINEWKTKELHEEMIAKAQSIGARIIELNDDIKIQLTDKSDIWVYNTQNTNYSNYNNISLGFLFRYYYNNQDAIRYFIQGDMSYSSEEFVGGQNIGKVDILKMGHHGNTSSNGEKWLGYLRPDYSIATIAYPPGNQVRLNTMRSKFVNSKVLIPNENRDYMNIAIDKDNGSIFTSAIEHVISNSWYQRDNGDWFYFKSDGFFATNESLIINERKYYFDINSKCTNPEGENIE